MQPQSLSGNCLKLGPYKIITVQTGYVAKTLRCGVLEILQAGQHILKDANHTFNEKDGFVSIKEETKTLKPVKALTSNGVVLEIKADVRYQIEDPLLAITTVDEIENTIFEIAKINIAQVVSHHSLSEFVPVPMSETAIVRQREDEDFVEVQHQAAKVKGIEATADSNAQRTIAEGKAAAIQTVGNAYRELADSMKDNPLAFQLYQTQQQVQMLAHGNNPHIIFQVGDSKLNSGFTMPLVVESEQRGRLSSHN